MKIVAGLGNPGLTYRKSRHNAGFRALDTLAGKAGLIMIKRRFNGIWGEKTIAGERVLFIKPQTYMNASGDCLQEFARFYKVAPEDILILYDDIDLPLGSIRIRSGGSAGTHNGMRSVVNCLGSQQMPRIRIGVGRCDPGEDLKDFVLRKPTPAEQEAINKACDDAAEAAYLILTGHLSDAQARFNHKHEGADRG